ncbi:hypothetical protein [Halobacteriovorax sp. CON-3]|uniref:hypothetical protein n=1 Tax=Halobacteriovorax sp. CON-3 TaxID=3157710 RepID=UPI0037117F22
MKAIKRKQAKIIHICRSEKVVTNVVEKKLVGLESFLESKEGTFYQLFLETDVVFSQGLRLNNPNIGVIVDGYFIKIGTLEQVMYNRKEVIEKFYDSTPKSYLNEILEQFAPTTWQ